jgi:hypothetical protein
MAIEVARGAAWADETPAIGVKAIAAPMAPSSAVFFR